MTEMQRLPGPYRRLEGHFQSSGSDATRASSGIGVFP
jgi:hypothetical protein